ncbi:MAG: hypothetical protein ACFFDH_04405 [Promethearchaeota archaeon]
MKQVKGSMVVGLVRGIKRNYPKRAEFNKILSDKAKDFLQQRILTASWYPFDTYRELYDASCLIVSENNPKNLYEMGVNAANSSFSEMYSSTVQKGDLRMAIERYRRFHGRIYNFGDTIVEFVSDNELIFIYKDMPRDWENWYHMIAGFALTFIELCIDKKVDYSFLNKSWEQEGWTKIKFSWTP